jgi:pyrroloquinoline quinone biosynthesis protein D
MAEITMESSPPLRRLDLMVRVIEREAVVLVPERTEVHQLNETATWVWLRCDGAHSVAEIAAQMSALYDAPVEVLLADVSELISDLERRNLLSRTTACDAGGVIDG